MYQKWVPVMAKCPLFMEIESDELEIMVQCLKPRVSSYNKNEYIALAGDSFEGIGIVLSGEIAVSRENAAGNRMIMDILKPGEMFGEMAAFSGSNEWPATVNAQEKCTVMFLPPDKILGECQKMCASHKRLVLNMLTITSKKALMLNRKLEYLSIKSMRGKIGSFLLEQYRKTGKLTFMMPMKRNELADFLNVSRPSLSREMCHMRDEGMIEFHRSAVQIKDLEALKETVE